MKEKTTPGGAAHGFALEVEVIGITSSRLGDRSRRVQRIRSHEETKPNNVGSRSEYRISDTGGSGGALCFFPFKRER